MKKGFVSVGAFIVIGLMTTLVIGGSFGIYKYVEIVEEKEEIEQQLIEQKNVQIQNLESEVESLQEKNTAPIDLVATSTENEKLPDEDIEISSTQEYKQENIEPNAAPIIAISYERTALEIVSSVIDLLNSYTVEADRYISGIPTLVSNLKSLARSGLNDSADIESILDDWGADYIKEFRDFKSLVNVIISEQKEHQSTMIQISKEISTQYVPSSQAAAYTSEIDIYSAQTDRYFEDLKTSFNTLTTRFIEDKDFKNEALYQIIKDNTVKTAPPLPVYSLPQINTATYKPPVMTYCQNFGSSISCTSY